MGFGVLLFGCCLGVGCLLWFAISSWFVGLVVAYLFVFSCCFLALGCLIVCGLAMLFSCLV